MLQELFMYEPCTKRERERGKKIMDIHEMIYTSGSSHTVLMPLTQDLSSCPPVAVSSVHVAKP